jgi:iron complex outermembrane receptor protein
LVLESGNYDLAHLTAVQNVPLTSSLALRAALDYTYHSGYDATGADSANNIAARISGLYSVGSDSYVYLWAYGVGKNGNVPNLMNKGYDLNTGSFSENAFLHRNPWDDTLRGPLQQFAIFGQPRAQNLDYENYAVGGELQFALGGNVTLTYIPSYFHLKEDYIQWNSAITEENRLHLEQVTQELRLAGNLSRLTWLAGLYGYRVTGAQLVLALVGTPAQGTYGNITDDEEKGAAGFGQATYSLLDTLRLTAGGRYSIDERTGAGLSPDSGTPFDFNGTFRHFDYKAGLEYDLTAQAMAYASFQTAYQPGTYEQFATTPERSNRVEPATLHAVTAGIKTRFLDNRLQVNDEAFSYDYHNFFAQAFNNNLHFNPLFNARKVRIYGDELNVTVRPTSADLFNANAAWTHARNVDFTTPSGQNFDDLSPAYAADWTAAVSLQHNYLLPSGSLALEGDARYESAFYADYAHSPGLRQPANTKGNASLTYHSVGDRWSVGVWIKNISNVAVMAAGASGGIPGPANVYLEPPRTYGARFTYSQ